MYPGSTVDDSSCEGIGIDSSLVTPPPLGHTDLFCFCHNAGQLRAEISISPPSLQIFFDNGSQDI